MNREQKTTSPDSEETVLRLKEDNFTTSTQAIADKVGFFSHHSLEQYLPQTK